jgi:dTDP-4-dehydrorhamnose reductase
MKHILITGANGQLGREFQAIASEYTSIKFLFATRDTLNIGDKDAIETYFHQNQIDICVNCAAYTAVDKAESEEKEAFAINAEAVRSLAAICQYQGIPIIQISTDYVYHSAQNIPFREDDEPNPQGVYAKSKFLGEYCAFEQNTKALVIRTSWVYSSFGHNFVKTMLRLAAERSSLNVVFDQIGTPTYARDLAKAILHIIHHMERKGKDWEEVSGVYNYSNEGVTSWYDFAHEIFCLKQLQCKVLPIETSQYPTPAKRPPFSLMNKQSIKETFELDIPHWKDSLKEMLSLI